MVAGIRTRDLRKVYNSAPPVAAGTGGFSFGAPKPKGKGKQPKPEIVALDGISLDILPGEIFCLLGPNGAGKSTTVGVLTTRVRPTSGQAFIGEHDVWQQQVAVKRLIGVVAQRPNLDFSLTAREILTFHGAYFGLSSQERAKRAEALLERFKLTDRADQMVRGFSGGMMQRLSIARAMMHDPQVLFLDEPSAGLDPQTRLLLWEIVREYNQGGKTILLTTHNMEEADALCKRLYRSRPRHRSRHSARIEGGCSWRLLAAPPLRPSLAGLPPPSTGPRRRPRSPRQQQQRCRPLRRPRRLPRRGGCCVGFRRQRRVVRRAHLRAQP